RRHVDWRHGVVVHTDGRRAMHHRRFSRELRRAVAHEDEESAYGRSVLQGEGEDLVDQLPENELPGHALDQPEGRRKTRRLAHGCVASARAMPHVRAPAEPITGRPERVLERRPPARSARAWGGGRVTRRRSCASTKTTERCRTASTAAPFPAAFQWPRASVRRPALPTRRTAFRQEPPADRATRRPLRH